MPGAMAVVPLRTPRVTTRQKGAQNYRDYARNTVFSRGFEITSLHAPAA